MDGKEEHGRDVDTLNVHNLQRMNSGHREGRRLFVSVVQLVEMLIKERRVVDPMGPVSQVILSCHKKVHYYRPMNIVRSFVRLPDEANDG